MVFIKRVIINGFKSYATQDSKSDSFDEKLNVIGIIQTIIISFK